MDQKSKRQSAKESQMGVGIAIGVARGAGDEQSSSQQCLQARYFITTVCAGVPERVMNGEHLY